MPATLYRLHGDVASLVQLGHARLDTGGLVLLRADTKHLSSQLTRSNQPPTPAHPSTLLTLSEVVIPYPPIASVALKVPENTSHFQPKHSSSSSV